MLDHDLIIVVLLFYLIILLILVSALASHCQLVRAYDKCIVKIVFKKDIWYVLLRKLKLCSALIVALHLLISECVVLCFYSRGSTGLNSQDWTPCTSDYGARISSSLRFCKYIVMVYSERIWSLCHCFGNVAFRNIGACVFRTIYHEEYVWIKYIFWKFCNAR